jgi:hypothetical protein
MAVDLGWIELGPSDPDLVVVVERKRAGGGDRTASSRALAGKQ